MCVFATLRSECHTEVMDPRSDNVDGNPGLKDDGAAAAAEEEDIFLAASHLG